MTFCIIFQFSVTCSKLEIFLILFWLTFAPMCVKKHSRLHCVCQNKGYSFQIWDITLWGLQSLTFEGMKSMNIDNNEKMKKEAQGLHGLIKLAFQGTSDRLSKGTKLRETGARREHFIIEVSRSSHAATGEGVVAVKIGMMLRIDPKCGIRKTMLLRPVLQKAL